MRERMARQEALRTRTWKSSAGEPGHGAFDGPALASEPLWGFDAFAGDAVGDAASAQPSTQVGVVVALVRVEFSLLGPPRPAAEADRRNALDQGNQGLAVVQVRARDSDRGGQTGELTRSTGCGPVRSPLFRARMFTESIAQRDRSSSPRPPSSSSATRWSLAHTRAFDHSLKRRWAVAPGSPKDAVGSSCPVQGHRSARSVFGRHRAGR